MPSVLLCVAFGVAVPGQGVHAQSVPTQNSAEDIEKSSEKKLNKNITTRTFDIRPGPLEPALDYFARISGINLSYDAASIGRATTQGLSGQFSIADGLNTLLEGTGLRATAQSGGGYALEKETAEGATSGATTAGAVVGGVPVTLPAVSVTSGMDRGSFLADRTSVGSKVTSDPHDIAQATTVVTKSLIESQGLTSFQDALRNVPGITIGGAEGVQIGNNINLRGFNAQTDIYLDGFRDSGQYYRDTFNLESIDVLYGPSSLLFGRGSTGGVVNQVSKKANLTESGQVSTTIGTDDQYRTTVDFNHPLSDTSAFRINAFGQDMGSTRDVMKNKDYGIAPELRFGIGTPTEITLSALIQHNDDMPDFGVPPINGHLAPVNKSTFYGLTDDRSQIDVQIFNATIKHKVDENLTIQNQTQWANYTVDERETSARSVLTGPLATSPALANGNFTTLPLSQLFVTLQSHDATISNHTLYNDTDLLYTFNTGFIKHDVDVGIELGHETFTDQATIRNNLPILSLLDPVAQATPANVTTSLGNLEEASANTFAAYFNDTVSLGSHWKVIGGVRWDNFRPEISNTLSAPGYTSQVNDFTSVRGGIIYQPNDAQSYYVSYGTSFNPSLEQLMVVNGTQNLAPETNKAYEIGSKWDFLNGKLSVTTSAFQIEEDNARSEIAAGAFMLDGDVRVRGMQAGVVGHITDKWQVYAGYAYLDARIVAADDGTAGNVPADTPRNTVTLWSTYEITPHWEIGGGPTYVSASYAVNNDLVQAPAYTRWDAEVAYHQKKYDVRLNLQNLTNKNYYTALLNSDGGRAVPGIGRTLLATLTYKFD